MLLDWGTPTARDAQQDIADHVTALLLPVLDAIGEPVHLVGYCLGGTIALAAAQLAAVRSLTLLATPWHFERYAADARAEMARMWGGQRHSIEAMGLMPMEVMQTLFWSLDPARTIAKYAAMADRPPDDAALMRFATLEDWANDGAPLTAAVASDLFERFVERDDPGRGKWAVEGTKIDPARLGVPARHLTATDDRIAPAASAPCGIATMACPSGHVGMITSSRAKAGCWGPIVTYLDQLR